MGQDAGGCILLARLKKEGLRPAPQADKATLIRRVYFDLTGLPPTPQQVDALSRDKSQGAWAKLIDKLLASPHYGEQWGNTGSTWSGSGRPTDSSTTRIATTRGAIAIT